MQERRRFVGRLELRLELLPSRIERLHLGFTLGHVDLVVEQEVQQLLDASADPLDLSLRGRQPGALLHPKSIRLLRELAAELVEEILAHQLLPKRSEDALLDILPRDRELVGACPAVAGAEASELLARIDDEAGAALAALREAREQVLRPPELVEAPAFLGRLPFALNARASRLYRLPDFIVDDTQLWHVLGDPLSRRIPPCDTFACVRILQKPLSIPNEPADIEFVVENADAKHRVSVNRARAPQRSARPANTFAI